MTARNGREHTVPLSGEWLLWKWGVVRGAGFPASLILQLAKPELRAAADELAELEDTKTELIERALRELRGEVEDREGTARYPFFKALKALQRDRVPDQIAGVDSDSLVALRAVACRLARRETEFEHLFDTTQKSIARSILSIATDPSFREALCWQNPHALHTAIDWLVAHPEGPNNAKRGQKHRLVASYMQRYCAKNDTIGFFGPIGWALVGPGSALEARPGSGLIADRVVCFEHWAIDGLGEHFISNPELRLEASPRLMGTVRLEGKRIHHGIGKCAELDPATAAVLSRCDGSTAARRLAADLEADPTHDLEPGEVVEILEDLAEAKLIRWRFEIPPLVHHPERYLRELLAGARGPAAERALAEIAALEEARDAVAAVAGDADALDRALALLADRFVEITGERATRHAGQTYGSRTLVYEDCRRDLELTIGDELVERIGPAVSLIFASARWYSNEVARRYRPELDAIYDQLRDDSGPIVDGPTFVTRAFEILPSTELPGDVVESVLAEMDRRWSQILSIDDDRRIERSSAALCDAVTELFEAPGPGWPLARHNTLDLMFSLEPEFRAIIGELHVGSCSLVAPTFLRFCPWADEIVRAYEAELSNPAIAPITPKRATSRASSRSPARNDYVLELGVTASLRPNAQVVRLADLVVERSGTGLVIRTRDERVSFDVIDFFEHQLQQGTSCHFSLLARRPHSPRITVDNVVVCREQWNVDTADLEFATLDRGSGRFRSTCRWARSLALPRHVFVKVPEEQKPMFVDFASPVLLDSLANYVRGSTRLSLSEMLPTIEDAWLPDVRGNSYTSEVRMTAVDRTALELEF